MFSSKESSPSSPEYGFTLIELLVTVAILGILAGMAIVNYTEIKQHAYRISVVAHMKDLNTSFHAGDAWAEFTTPSANNFEVRYDIGQSNPVAMTIYGTPITINETNLNKYLPGFEHSSKIYIDLSYAGTTLQTVSNGCHCADKNSSSGLRCFFWTLPDNTIELDNVGGVGTCP